MKEQLINTVLQSMQASLNNAQLVLLRDGTIVIENAEGVELYISAAATAKGEIEFGVNDSIEGNTAYLPNFVSVNGNVSVLADSVRGRKISDSASISKEEVDAILSCSSYNEMLKKAKQFAK